MLTPEEIKQIVDDVTLNLTENKVDADQLTGFRQSNFYTEWHNKFKSLGLTGVVAIPNTTFTEWLYWFQQWSEKFTEAFNALTLQLNQLIEYLPTALQEIFDKNKDYIIKPIEDKIDQDIGGFLNFKQPRGENFIQKLTNEFNQRAVNILWFGAKADGVTDDSQAIQDAANFLINIGGGNLIFPSHEKINMLHTVQLGSNITVDFNNCEIIWNGVLTSNIGRFEGIFNAKGQLISGEYSVTDVNLHTNNIGSDSTTVFNEDGYFTSTAYNDFVVGDYLLFKINTGNYNAAQLNPKDEKLVRITKIEGTKVFIDYSSPYLYENFTYTATIQKVSPVENVYFKNIYINDTKVLPTKNVNAPHPDDVTFVSGLSVQYGVNIGFDKIRAYNTKLPVIFLNHVTNVSVERGYLNSSALVGPGEGYYTQFNYCNNIFFNECHAFQSRHLVDFTGSSFASVNNSTARKMYSMSFQLHGAYEHHIYYNNNVGTFNADSGTLFGNANRDITFNHHTGWITSNGYTSNYSVVNSDVKLIRAFTSLSVSNSKIIIDLGNQSTYAYRPDSRSGELTKTIIDNCEINFLSDFQSSVIYDIDFFTITNSTINTLKDFPTGQSMLIDLTGLRKVTLNNNNIKFIKLRFLSPDAKEITFTYKNNVIYMSADTWHITAKNLLNSSLKSRIEGNRFINTFSSTENANAIYLNSTDGNSNSVQRTWLLNNEFERCVVLSSFSNSDDSFVSRDNVIKKSSYTVGSDIPYRKVDDLIIN